ncbi:MAG TPA: PEP-CTERM sorting domain-containing protein [Terriglobales bacterium]|nr:PEP-CTERM sorting domain-containing protein [Terriglobales bacterium]
MRKFAPWVLCALMVAGLGMARADTVSFVGVVGSYGTSTTTIGGIVIHAYYWDSTTNTWKDANLFGRNQTNDHGLGVCNPVEAGCGTGDGGGDVNELDNAGQKELISLELPAGYEWVSVQLSSLDKNDSSLASHWEQGQIWADSDGVPMGTTNIGDSIICQYTPGTSVGCANVGGTLFEPMVGIVDAGSPYLFFQAKDWKVDGYTNTNNDYLIMSAVIVQTPEPGSLILLGTGLVGLGTMLRKGLR